MTCVGRLIYSRIDSKGNEHKELVDKGHGRVPQTCFFLRVTQNGKRASVDENQPQFWVYGCVWNRSLWRQATYDT